MVVLLPAGVLAEGRSKARSGGSRPHLACALVDWSELPGVASTSGHATTYRTAQRMLQALHEKLLGCSAAHEACKGRHTCHHEFLCVSDYWGLLRLPVSNSLILTGGSSSQRWHTRFLCLSIVRGQRALSTHEDVVRSLCEVVEAWAEPMHPGEEDQGEDPVSLLAPLSCFSTGAPTTEDEWMWTAGKVLRKPFTAKVAFYSGIPPILRRMRLPHSKTSRPTTPTQRTLQRQ